MQKKFALSILIVLFFACKEEDVINAPELTSTQACEDNLTAEKIFNDIIYIIEKGLKDNGQSKSCPNYTIMNTDTSDIDTLIINFGSENCLSNGKLRKGIINVTYNGKYYDAYSVTTITFDNYYLNNKLVQGEQIITNQGVNNEGNVYFTIDVNDASITTENGTINWESNTEREWINGEESYFDISDDEYKIIGTARGNGVNGNDFIVEIIDTLYLHMGCLPSCVIRYGNTKVSPNGYPDRIIHYGDSLCDCNVDVIINEKTYPIVID